jgi:hypothetical protein
MNLILGSGLIGSLARTIFGDGWQWVPFKKSRYYSFNIPLADNYVVYDPAVESVMRNLCPSTTPIMYKRPYSFMGQLMYHDLGLESYLKKLYGDKVPILAKTLFKSSFMTYNTTAQRIYNQLERTLEEKRDNDIKSLGELVELDLVNKKAKFVRRISDSHGETIIREFDKIISTIPLDAFLKLAGRSADFLVAKSECMYHIHTKHDVENASQILVSDLDILFHKVQVLDKDRFVFHTLEPIPDAYGYFGSCFGYNLDIADASRIENSIPIGEPPDMTEYEQYGVYCVGSNAQWDNMMDITSCLKRLLTLSSSV